MAGVAACARLLINGVVSVAAAARRVAPRTAQTPAICRIQRSRCAFSRSRFLALSFAIGAGGEGRCTEAPGAPLPRATAPPAPPSARVPVLRRGLAPPARRSAREMSDEENEGGGEEGNIEIYLRIKPIANPSKKVQYDLTEGKARAPCELRESCLVAYRCACMHCSRSAGAAAWRAVRARRPAESSCVEGGAWLRATWRRGASVRRGGEGQG